MHHPRARAGQLEHLGVGDVPQQPRVRHESRIGSVDAADVGEDLTGLRFERRRKRYGRRVRATASKRGHFHISSPMPLEAGHDDDPPGGQLALDPPRGQADDARLRMALVGLDAGLKSEEGDGRGCRAR